MIKIICFGHLKKLQLKELASDYLRRMNNFPFLKIEIVEFKDDHMINTMRRIDDYVEKNDGRYILLDENGKDYTTIEFKDFLKPVIEENEDITFIIGGADGFENDWKKKFESMKISSMVFTHEMARVLFIEQLYREATLHAGIPYHKE